MTRPRARLHQRGQTAPVGIAVAAALGSVGALLACRAFTAAPSFRTSKASATALRAVYRKKEREEQWDETTDAYQAQNPSDLEAKDNLILEENMMDRKEGQGWTFRDVKVEEQRDLNELMRLPNPLQPTEGMQLAAITLSDGTRVDYPKIGDLKSLKVSRLRPATFTWRDKAKAQTRAPKQYDEIIQRLLNAGSAEMEDLVRANWKMFDKAFFFRLTELKDDTNDSRLKEKISNLETIALDLIKAAQNEMRKSVPQAAKEARQILDSMLEGDGDTLLWPPPPEAYKRLSEKVNQLSVRNQFEDGWFETTLEVCERFGKKMQAQQKTALYGMCQVCMQRIITEWLRHDTLWEETDEGRFLFRLMNLSHEQWASQLVLEQAPLDVYKMRDELKIISENKIMPLPMGSKLQVYAAKYIQGLVEFVTAKDDILSKLGRGDSSGDEPRVEVMA